MGFIGGLLSAVVKTVATPIVMAGDLVTLGKADLTKKHLESVSEDID